LDNLTIVAQGQETGEELLRFTLLLMMQGRENFDRFWASRRFRFPEKP
jgi:hypothetical protein